MILQVLNVSDFTNSCKRLQYRITHPHNTAMWKDGWPTQKDMAVCEYFKKVISNISGEIFCIHLANELTLSVTYS